MTPPGLRRAILVQALSNAGLSAAGLFVPLVARQLGATDLELGLIGACFGATLFVSAWVFGRIADQGQRRRVIQGGMFAAALAAPVHALATDPLGLGLARGLFGFAAGIFPAALIAYAYDAQRRPGRFAGWGSLGWGVGTVAAGFLGLNDGVFYLSAALLTLGYLVAMSLAPREQPKLRVPWFPREVLRTNLPVYMAMLLRHVGAAAVWIIFPLYLVQLGAAPEHIGLLYFLNTGSQFLFMGFLDRYPARALVLAGLGSSVLVFVAFAALPRWEFALPLQLLLAASWAFLYVGTLAWVMERNVERSTSTGLLHSSTHLSNVVGPVLGGAVAFAWGYGATMLFAAAMSLVAIPVFLASARRLERERPAAEVVVSHAGGGPGGLPQARAGPRKLT